MRIEKVLFAVKDIDGFDEIQKSLDSLKEETEKWLKTNFEQWRDQAMTLISQGDLTYVFFLHRFNNIETKCTQFPVQMINKQLSYPIL